MKSERRHELQQNELAQWIDRTGEEVRPYLGLIVGALVVALLAAVAWAWLAGSQERGWSEFFSAHESGDADQLLAVARQFEGSTPANWALQAAADLQASQGTELIFSDRKQAEELLLSARTNYKKVTAAANDELLSQRAWIGFAKAEECLYAITGDPKNLESAREAYQTITKTWPDSAIAKTAASQLSFLAMNDSQEFYGWLAELKLARRPQLEMPSDFQLPGLDVPGLPGSDLDLSFDPNSFDGPAGLPAGTDEPPPGEPTTEPPAGDPVSEPPAVDSAKPSTDESLEESPGDPPATDAPATDPPATDPPATEAPATDPPAGDAAQDSNSDPVDP